MESSAVSMFKSGVIIADGKTVDAESLPWNEHATFKGVYLKHLVTGSMTGGRLSCHLIRIEAGRSIGDHVHPDKYELHEVISGEAAGDVNGKPYPYVPGTVSVIPQGVQHRIVAGKEDVYLLAKFFPALL